MSVVSSRDQFITLRRLSVLGAVLTAGLSVVLYQSLTAFTLLGVGASSGFALYALLGRVPDVADTRSRLQETLPVAGLRPGLLSLGFLLSNAVAIFSLTGAYYNKPLIYYVAIAVAAGFLGLRVILTDAHLTNGALAFIYGLNTFVTNQIAFPLGLNGPDIGVHVGLAQSIVETSHLTGDGVYTGFPAQHLLAASMSLATGTPAPESYRFIGVLGLVLVIPLTYLLARRYGSRRFAVFSMLVVGSMEYVVYRAGHPSKLAYALTFLVLIFTTVVYLNSKRTPGLISLFALFSMTLVFTHHHTAFVTLVFLAALGIGQQLLTRIEESRFGGSLFADGGPNLSQPADNTAGQRRTHVLALLFAIAFITQFLYFAQYYQTLVSIATQYTDILFQTGGADSEATKATPRFSTIPLRAIFLNTIGSGILAGLAVLGVLHQFQQRMRFAYVLFGWMVTAAVLMGGGVIFDVPFALPNRVYVITELTGAGLFTAAGIVYLVRQTETRRLGRVLVGGVVVLIVGFALFSTASTIAGIETSPFNEDVPHRTWYGMTEEDAATSFAEGHNLDAVEAVRGFPVDRETGQLDYSTVEDGDIVELNLHKIQTGINVRGGQGRIGTGIWYVPDDPRVGLGDELKLYDNGPLELYQFRE